MSYSFKLTPEAKAALRKFLKGAPGIEHAIFAPVQDSGDITRKRWGMGVYERKHLNVNEPDIVEVEGLEFYIDPSMAKALSGQTLSFVDGAFVIV